MTKTLINVFHSNATGKNMSVGSQKLLCCFYILKRKFNKETPVEFPSIHSNVI